MRTQAKRDKNEREIITALEAIGCKVWQVSDGGILDLLVLSPMGHWRVIEVKSKGGKLTTAQLDFIEKAGFDNIFVAYDAESAAAYVLGQDATDEHATLRAVNDALRVELDAMRRLTVG